jgi:hypothetical protein
MQNDIDTQETAESPEYIVYIGPGVENVVPLNSVAFSASSTATQKLEDAHEIEVK